jgi:hypothetical protein
MEPEAEHCKATQPPPPFQLCSDTIVLPAHLAIVSQDLFLKFSPRIITQNYIWTIIDRLNVLALSDMLVWSLRSRDPSATTFLDIILCFRYCLYDLLGSEPSTDAFLDTISLFQMCLYLGLWAINRCISWHNSLFSYQWEIEYTTELLA